MTFKHKLSRRLALLKDAWLVVALAALGCEKPLAVTDPGATIRLQITPKSVTMPTDGAAQLMAVALTPAGDTATIDVNWSVTGGTQVTRRPRMVSSRSSPTATGAPALAQIRLPSRLFQLRWPR